MAEEDEGDKTLTQTALGRAASEFGRELEPLGKEAGEVVVRAVRVGLHAVSGFVWAFEQIADFVEKAVAKKLKDVPPEKIVAADPRIAVPAIEALRYSGQDADIREMFASLIASDMNSDTKERAHPSFVEIIKQMSAIDAKLLRAVIADHGGILFSGRLHFMKDQTEFTEVNLLLTVGVRGVSFESLIKAVYSLERFGLLRLSETTHPAGDTKQKVTVYLEGEDHKKFLKQFETIPDFRFKGHHIGIHVTPLGSDFARACL